MATVLAEFDLQASYRFPQELQIESVMRLREVISKYLLVTPCTRLNWIDDLTRTQVSAKFESQQLTGSFKIRGALSKLLSHPDQREFVTASAGNHALAVAEAAAILNRKVSFVVPTTASELKVRRLAQYGQALIRSGGCLFESIEHAKRLSNRSGSEFISPFDDIDVIAGQATIGVEVMDQLAQATALVVPVGGGGLISGVGAFAKQINPSIRVIGVEPESYNTVEQAVRGHVGTAAVSEQPTFGDGLAVRLESDSITRQIAATVVDDFVRVSEEEFAVATKTLLLHEGKLVEPSGASALVPVLRGELRGHRVLVIFTGGNVSTTGISKIIHYPFSSERYYHYVDFHGRSAERSEVHVGVRNEVKLLPDAKDAAPEAPVDFLREQFSMLQERYLQIKKDVSRYTKFCMAEKLMANTAALDLSEKLVTLVDSLLQDIHLKLTTLVEKSGEYDWVDEYRIEQSMRVVRHLLLPLRFSFDWRSPSYSQSTLAQFFELASQGNSGVNYNRYESKLVAAIEGRLKSLNQVDGTKFDLLVTSSGMSAYSLIESFLIRHANSVTTKVLIPHYVYFEASEQLESLQNVNVVTADTYSREQILELVKEHEPEVLFLDTLANTEDMRLVDVRGIIYDLEEMGADLSVIIDGTMLSGAFFDLFSGGTIEGRNTQSKIKVFYFESGSKYLQLGSDSSMSGFAIFPIEYQQYFQRLRRNMGAILYDLSALLFPDFSSPHFMSRMKRMTQNALSIGTYINGDPLLQERVSVIFPGLSEHPDFQLSKSYSHLGGVITFSFRSRGVSTREALGSLIEIVLFKARATEVPLVKGVSFGFSIPRISAASAMAETMPPFLRLSVGDMSQEYTTRLAAVIRESLREFFASFAMDEG